MGYFPTLHFADYAKYRDVKKWLKYRLHCLNSALGLVHVTKSGGSKLLYHKFHSICGE